MSLAVNGSLVIQRFERRDVIEIYNRTILIQFLHRTVMPLVLSVCYLHFMSGVQCFLIGCGSCCGNENENTKDVECCFENHKGKGGEH